MLTSSKIRQAFWRLVLFLKDFWESMKVDVRVIFLVKDDKTLYMPM